MAEIPQLKEAYPVLNAQRVSSEAEGFESFAKTLASFAQKEAQTAVQLNKEKSDTMYMNSVANAEQAKRDAQIQLLEHPENADKILENSKQNLDEIKNSAYVNERDRAKLGKSIQSAQGDISLDVAKTSVRQHQLIAAQTHFMNWPDQVAAYKDMLRTDPNNADKMYDSLVGSLKGLVASRVITPLQAANNLKDIRGAVDLEARYHHLLKNSNASAEDYHRVDSSPYNNGKDNTGSPISEDTGWLVDHFASDKSMKNIDANLFDHKLPNMEVYSSITENERNHVDQVQEGIQAADGLIRSGGSYPEVTRRLDALDSHKDSLNVRDNATRIALQDFKNGLKNDYLGTVSSLPAGKSILRDYNDRNAAIGQMAGVSDVEKQRMMNENNDHMVSQMVAYGQAIHAPSDQIKPFPKAVVTAAQQGFNMNGDPGLTLSTLRGYSPQNQVYLANSMKTPKQQVVMQTISFGGKKLADQDALDFIAANQDRSYKEIDLKTEDSVTDNYLKNQISTQIPNAIKIIQAQNDSRNAVTLNGQLIQAGANYSKYLSEKRGQFSFKKDGGIFDSINNVGDSVRLINASYAPVTGADYVFNKNQLDVTQQQADNLAMYAREGANKHLKSYMTPLEHQVFSSNQPLIMSVTPTGDLVAKDPSGNVQFSEHLTTNLMKHIQSEMTDLKNKRRDEQVQGYVFKQFDRAVRTYSTIKEAGEALGNAIVPPAYGGEHSTSIASNMRMTNNGYSFIKQWEGDPHHPGKAMLNAYDDGHGTMTIGWGHTAGVKEGDKIDLPTAERYLREDTRDAVGAVRKYITKPVTQNQFHALVSFALNEGAGGLQKSTLRKLINKGGATPEQIKAAFRLYDKAKDRQGNLRSDPGLKNRRELEIKLFFKGKK